VQFDVQQTVCCNDVRFRCAAKYVADYSRCSQPCVLGVQFYCTLKSHTKNALWKRTQRCMQHSARCCRDHIRALSAHSAAEFISSSGRWQHVWLVAIVPPERWGKMDINDCHIAWGNFKTLISSLNHSKNYACSFSFIDFDVWWISNVVKCFTWKWEKQRERGDKLRGRAALGNPHSSVSVIVS
jgi:hypothetical protein